MHPYAYAMSNVICENAGLDGIDELTHDLAQNIEQCYAKYGEWRAAILASCHTVADWWGSEFFAKNTLLAAANETLITARI